MIVETARAGMWRCIRRKGVGRDLVTQYMQCTIIIIIIIIISFQSKLCAHGTLPPPPQTHTHTHSLTRAAASTEEVLAAVTRSDVEESR